MAQQFAGFSLESLNFLTNVRLQNSKEWFEFHRAEYNDFLLKPFQNLVSTISEHVLTIDPLFEVRPSINKTISRIFRDTRFSHDKSLYRDTMWLTFKRPKKEALDTPAFFFEISPHSYRYGMGYYSASKNSMDTFRQMIDENETEFKKAISFFTRQNLFAIEGSVYKRPLKELPPELSQWYNRKSLYLVHNSIETNRLFTNDIAKDLISGFTMLSLLYHYLCSVEARKNRIFNQIY